MQPICTNNDIKGWHNAINRRAGGRCVLPFYELIYLLHIEARIMALHVRLVSEGKINMISKEKVCQFSICGKILTWERNQPTNFRMPVLVSMDQ
ncbi:hypothetical protein LSH36_250g03037 [Paralvinella palmiformis]|uniref:Uncharacterized protein n=1 Tax=Paralvinella palmiformis TaxID=53620 RepID=A0AAD9JM86_9ANNE|nr:hypothetical protein LSH36_250g03037 [Paralvinella palmiformis]